MSIREEEQVKDEVTLAQALEPLAQRVSELVLAGMPQPVQGERQEWFTPKQAAIHCGVTEEAVRNAIKANHLRAYRRGQKSLALHIDDLNSYMRGAA